MEQSKIWALYDTKYGFGDSSEEIIVAVFTDEKLVRELRAKEPHYDIREIENLNPPIEYFTIWQITTQFVKGGCTTSIDRSDRCRLLNDPSDISTHMYLRGNSIRVNVVAPTLDSCYQDISCVILQEAMTKFMEGEDLPSKERYVGIRYNEWRRTGK